MTPHAVRTASISAVLLVAAATGTAEGQEAADRPPAVTVQKLNEADFTIKVKLPGRIKASMEAEIRPQVSGIIEERLFEEGARIKAGQPLYKIEDATYVAAVASAKASVAEAQADLDISIIEANRAQNLLENRSGTASNRDSTAAQRSKADALLQSAKAKLKTAEIDEDRTTIRASIDGVIGFSQTTSGSLVAAQQTTALTTIRTLDPIYVDVTQSATELLAWQPPETSDAVAAQSASLILPDGKTYESQGDMRAAEPKVEPTTGMVTLRVSFANPDYRLLPGLYVEVELPVKTIPNAIVVPQGAIMRKPDGTPYAWVVDDGKVVERNVVINTGAGNKWVTTSGLKDGDSIITAGFQKVKPGSAVSVAQDAPTTSSPSNEGK